ncbi:MAG TPA: ABC transporter ATP-binding protein [Acidimicrobiales bacterium]|nr:ABC transporter ATP-binding protein [Acidimicrobiales bacterium]
MAELHVEGLTVRYGAVTALEDVSVVAPAASITAVLGANGAGKTTLLRTISGLLRPVAGSVRVDGREITGLPPESIAVLGVAQVPEGGGVIRELTVDENLRLGGLIAPADGKAKGTAWVYDLFPALAARRRRSAFTLSGGERQMLAIGRALMAQPRVLLLDEPSLGLAPMIVAEIMALLRRLSTESHLAVLLVEQNARSALSIADRALVLHLGHVVKADDAGTVASDEGLRHAYLGF